VALDVRHRLFCDATDFVEFMRRAKSPSGIQRVQQIVFRSLIERAPAGAVAPTFFTIATDGQVELLDTEKFSAVLKGGDVPLDLVQERRTALSLGDLVAPGQTGLIFITGAPWNYGRYARILLRLKEALRAPVVQLIHDLLPLSRPNFFTDDLVRQFGHYFESCTKLIDRFVCVSQATAEDLILLQQFAEDRALDCDVLRNPSVPLASGQAAARRFKSLDRFVLCVGTIEIRKNHEHLARVWSRLISQLGDATPTLVCVGKLGWKAEGFARLIALEPRLSAKIKIISDASDEDLRELYDRSLFTVYPSFCEGFGLPLAESLSRGKMAIAGNHSALVEASGGFAEHLDPYDVAGWVRKVAEYLEDPRRGDRRIEDFAHAFADDEARYVAELTALMNRWLALRPQVGAKPELGLETLFIDRSKIDPTKAMILPLTGQRCERRNFEQVDAILPFDGWFELEDWGTWSRVGSPALSLPDCDPTLDVHVVVRGKVIPAIAKTNIGVFANGTLVGAVRMDANLGTHTVTVPAGTMRGTGDVLQFAASISAEQLAELRAIDPRCLFVGLQSIYVTQINSWTAISSYLTMITRMVTNA
jgi:glycosyltransferase involved in cell wall biosynthesis